MANRRAQEPAYSFLYDPSRLSSIEIDVPIDELLFAANNLLDNPLNLSQENVFRDSFINRLTLLWGPPGTGKTTLLAAMVIGWLKKAQLENSGLNIVVGSSNWNAIDNLLIEIADLVEALIASDESITDIEIHRVRGFQSQASEDNRLRDTQVGSQDAVMLSSDLDSSDKLIIVGSTWKQMYNLTKPNWDEDPQPKQWFDVALIDEASQVKVSQASEYFLLMKESGNVVFAGDDKQLGPIFGFEIENNSDGLYDCIFTYMKDTHRIDPQIITSNYRSNEEIVDWPRGRFYGGQIEAINSMNALNLNLPTTQPEDWPDQLVWNDDYLAILDPNLPVVIITYPSRPYTVSNPFESQLTSAISLLYKKSLIGVSDDQFYSRELGIVTPHRAQRSNIQNILTSDCEMENGAQLVVDTVDRFQGQERELIIASYSVADKDFVKSEESFILDSRRFNVSLTRARSKFIMMISEAVINHLPSDRVVAIDAAHIQLFVLNHCESIRQTSFGYMDNGQENRMECKIKGKRRT